jgi:hypothetical protein
LNVSLKPIAATSRKNSNGKPRKKKGNADVLVTASKTTKASAGVCSKISEFYFEKLNDFNFDEQLSSENNNTWCCLWFAFEGLFLKTFVDPKKPATEKKPSNHSNLIQFIFVSSFIVWPNPKVRIPQFHVLHRSMTNHPTHLVPFSTAVAAAHVKTALQPLHLALLTPKKLAGLVLSCRIFSSFVYTNVDGNKRKKSSTGRQILQLSATQRGLRQECWQKRDFEKWKNFLKSTEFTWMVGPKETIEETKNVQPVSKDGKSPLVPRGLY